MQMTGQRLLPVTPQQAWNALNDPQMLKACIPGCESVTETGPHQYEVLMAARIGPVSAKFKGRLVQSDIVEPLSYTLAFDGQGGVAGFGKGKAEVRLEPVPEGTQLHYTASAQVGGKIAQIGSRLVDAAASKIADEFFAAFETALTHQAEALQAAMAAASTPAAGSEASAASETTTATGPAARASGSTAAAPEPAAGTASDAPSAAPAASGSGSGRQRWWQWALAFAAAAALMAWINGKGPA
jgi:carbon monoxide dehydrogenase subunit G